MRELILMEGGEAQSGPGGNEVSPGADVVNGVV